MLTCGAITTVQFLSFTPTNFISSGLLSQASQASLKAEESERKAAVWRLELIMNVADNIEWRMGLTETSQYIAAASYI